METPLIQLLLDCLHQDPKRITAARLGALNVDDWEALVSLAKTQRVAPLLYHRLKALGVVSAETHAALSVLRNHHRQNALRNLRFFADLNPIVKALQSEKIPVIALKGAHLAQAVYGNIALREMNDFDLLVPPDRLARAGEILAAQGYRPSQPYDPDLALVTVHHLPRFLKPKALSVELHWSITQPGSHYAIDPGALWHRAVPVQIAGLELLGLAAEDLLLHLCLHTSYQHQFQFGLRPSCDIAALIHHCGKTLDWEAIRRRTMAWGWQKGVFLALKFARDLVGAAVPEDLLRKLVPKGFDESIADTAFTQLFTDKAFAHRLTHEAAKVLDRPNLWRKLNGMAARIFLPRNIIAQIYGVSAASWRVYLYYPMRMKDLVFRYGDIIRELRQGDKAMVQLTRRKRVIADWLAQG